MHRPPHVAIASMLIAVTAALTFGSPARADDAPKPGDVEKVLKRTWDKAGGSYAPKEVLTLNAVRFGKPYAATAQEVQVEGLPKGTVTPAIVDFTVRTYDANQTQVLRRVREARIYKDKMDEWAVMTGSVRGEDVSSTEPAVR